MTAQDGAHGKPESQVLDFPYAGGGDGVFPEFVENAEKLVTLIGHGPLQPCHSVPGGFMENRGPGRGQVDRCILHAADGFQGVFHAANAGGAGHPAHGDGRFFQSAGKWLVDLDDLISQLPDPFAHLLGADGLRVEVHNGLFGGEIDGGLLHAGHFPQPILHAAHAGSTRHPRDVKNRLIRQRRTPLRRFFS